MSGQLVKERRSFVMVVMVFYVAKSRFQRRKEATRTNDSNKIRVAPIHDGDGDGDG